LLRRKHLPGAISADHWNKRRLLPAGYALGALVALSLASGAGSLPMLPAAFVLAATYVGLEETEDSLAAESGPPLQRGAGFGLLAMGNGIGDWISRILTG
jgi:hypothetical protein